MRWRTLLGLALAVGCMAPPVAQGQDTRPGIGVWILENGGSYGQDAEDFEALRVGLQQILMTELARNPAMRVVERSQLNALIAEQDLGAAGRVDPETAARVGRIVGAKFMVLGGFVDWFGDFRLDARIVDCETTEIIVAIGLRERREELYQLIVDLTGRLTNDVNLPSLDIEAELEEQAREIPVDALTLFSRAVFFEDRGDSERAKEFYTRARNVFPDYTEAAERLRQLGGS
ncbi:MAG: CsgG/HfaB family protein [Gemmatimonadales bacterium]